MDAPDGKVAVMAIPVLAWLRPKVHPVQGDFSKPDDLDRLYEVVRKVKGRVYIVFANAGVVNPAGGNRCKQRLSRTVRRNG
jgi:NAD(P)-dependent dehydrogenase (short-subunit alcohol dehydrogenase family)